MTKPKTPSTPRSQKLADPVEQEGANPRQASLDAFYLNGGPDFSPGNAYKSAIAAGYSSATAKSNCHILARRASIKVARALEALGCDGFSQGGQTSRTARSEDRPLEPEEREVGRVRGRRRAASRDARNQSAAGRVPGTEGESRGLPADHNRIRKKSQQHDAAGGREEAQDQ